MLFCKAFVFAKRACLPKATCCCFYTAQMKFLDCTYYQRFLLLFHMFVTSLFDIGQFNVAVAQRMARVQWLPHSWYFPGCLCFHLSLQAMPLPFGPLLRSVCVGRTVEPFWAHFLKTRLSCLHGPSRLNTAIWEHPTSPFLGDPPR